MFRARIAFLLALLLPLQARAQEIMSLVRADRWMEAAQAAARHPDPVAAKLVTWYRLLAPGGGTAAEIAAFMADSPDWPLQGTLARRRDEALAAEADDAAALAQCETRPQAIAALLRCAEAYSRAGRADEAAAAARAAWVTAPAEPGWEAGFLSRWAAVIGRADHWRRFDRLAWSDPAGAQRQLPRLDETDRRAAEARLALKRDDPAAPGLVAGLTGEQRAESGLLLDQVRALRRSGQDDAALALWRSDGTAAEARAPAERLPAFWDERNLLARRRLRANDPAGAYALAAGHAQSAGEARLDAEFLAGFIALRMLEDRALATRHFRALADASRSAITQGRAHYWLGRAAADPAVARAEFAASAAYPNTFYGQLAAAALGDGGLARRLATARDPAADPGQALDFAGRELARAAALLWSWGEPRRAHPFLLRLDDIAPDAPDRSLAARLAAGLGMPEVAVAIARRAGRDGVVLIDSGWPAAVELPAGSPVQPALALGIIRQESSFDSSVVSPAGARGLMQLMPATATQTGRRIGLSPTLPSLTADPGLNMRLGTAYLHELLDQFGGCVPLAVAAYNAGPNRVTDWLATNGDPRGNTDPIDWIELIPFGETRNYVQRVIENAVIYAARRGEAAPHDAMQCRR
ncbi:MAG TPA: lytic transglycosylase domain-containing protein [Acetobacteraceae bacterium]